MTLRHERLVVLFAALAGAALALLAMSPLLVRGMSPVTAGVVLGLAAAFCLLGIVYGVWDARRMEAKRKAKEQIWMKH